MSMTEAKPLLKTEKMVSSQTHKPENNCSQWCVVEDGLQASRHPQGVDSDRIEIRRPSELLTVVERSSGSVRESAYFFTCMCLMFDI